MKIIKLFAFIAAIGICTACLAGCAAHKAEVAPVAPVTITADKPAPEWYSDGNDAYMQGKYEDAVALYDRAVMLDPAFEAAYLNRGAALGKLGRNEEALESFDKVIALNPASTTTYISKGRILIAMKRYDDALASLDKALALDAKSRAARIATALALLRRGGGGDPEKAKEILTQLLAEKNNDVAAARAYALLGDRENMLNTLKYLVAVAPAVKTYIGSEMEFEPYRDDPGFIEALKGNPEESGIGGIR